MSKWGPALKPAEIVLMKKACKITGDALKYAETLIKPGISTYELDKMIESYIIEQGGKPNFKGYGGFPSATCMSVNDVVVHGFPSKEEILQEGDIVSIDLGASYKGYNGDACRTFPVGKVSPEKQKLIDVTRECFFEGIKHLKVGNRLGEVSNAIQTHAEKFGFSVVREFVGHGIGRKLHMEPNIPNYGKATDGPIIPENVCVAIEPMINMGEKGVFILDNDWTVVTRDQKPSAHYENTVLILKDRIEILTI